MTLQCYAPTWCMEKVHLDIFYNHVLTQLFHLVPRDVFLQEKSQLKVELEQVQNELIICKATLEKEQEGRSIMEKDHRLLLAEKRDLLSE